MTKIVPILLLTSLILVGCSSEVGKMESTVEYANYKTDKAKTMYATSLEVATQKEDSISNAIIDYTTPYESDLEGVDMVTDEIHQELLYILTDAEESFTLESVTDTQDIKYYFNDDTYILEQVIKFDIPPYSITGISLKWFDGRLISVEKISY